MPTSLCHSGALRREYPPTLAKVTARSGACVERIGAMGAIAFFVFLGLGLLDAPLAALLQVLP